MLDKIAQGDAGVLLDREFADLLVHEVPNEGGAVDGKELGRVIGGVRERVAGLGIRDLAQIIRGKKGNKLDEIHGRIESSSLPAKIQTRITNILTRYFLLVSICLVRDKLVGPPDRGRHRETLTERPNKEVDPERVQLYADAIKALIKEFNQSIQTRKCRGRKPRTINPKRVTSIRHGGDLPIIFKDLLRTVIFVQAAKSDTNRRTIKLRDVERLMDDEAERMAATQALIDVFPNLKNGANAKKAAAAIFARCIAGRRALNWHEPVRNIKVGLRTVGNILGVY